MLPDTKSLEFKKLKLKILLAVVILIGAWVFGLTKYVDNLPMTPTADKSIADGIVILTGGSKRIGEGIDLLESGAAERLFISGVGERSKLDVLLMLSGPLPDDIAVLKDRIDLGYEAQNTRGNAIEVSKWVNAHNYKTIRLVTANYHMQRSYFELQSQMPEIKIIQNPVFPEDIRKEKWWNHGITKKVMISEYNKYIVSRIAAFFGM